MADLSFRPYGPGEEEAINQAFNEVFQSCRSLSEWRWKFLQNPYGCHIMLAWEGSQLLAQYAGVAVPFRAFGTRVKAAQIVDVFSRKTARRTLAAGKAYLGALEAFISRWCSPRELALSFGFPSRRPLQLGQHKHLYNQVPPQPVPRLWRELRPGRGPLPTKGLVFNPPWRQVAELWQQCSGGFGLAVEREETYLRHRYGRAPNLYLCWGVAGPEGLTAWAVGRPHGEVFFLAELLFLEEGALATLLTSLEHFARELGSRRLEAWLGGDYGLTTALLKLGWRLEEHPQLWLVTRSFDPQIPPEKIPGAFYFTLGDSDLI